MSNNTVTINCPSRMWANALIFWLERTDLEEFFSSEEAGKAERITNKVPLDVIVDIDPSELTVQHKVSFTLED